MTDLTIQTLLIRVASLLVIAVVYGGVAAVMARLLGDPGPVQDGRLSANPMGQLDALGAAALVLFGFGWIQPLHLTPARLRGGGFGIIAVVAAATIALLAVAASAALLLPLAATMLSDSSAPLARAVVNGFVGTAAGFAVVNLIPIPPLAAGMLVDAIWPVAGAALRRASLVVGLALIVLLVTDYPQDWLEPAARNLARWLMAGR